MITASRLAQQLLEWLLFPVWLVIALGMVLALRLGGMGAGPR
jgi:hypothetical protein